MFGWHLLLLSLPASCCFILHGKRPAADRTAAFRKIVAAEKAARQSWLVLWTLAVAVVGAAFLFVGNLHYSADYYGVVAITEEYLKFPQNYDKSPYLKGEYFDWAHIHMVPLLMAWL